MSERPGRYQRSFSGLVGAMLVLLVVVVLFVVFRESVRDTPEASIPAVDYREDLKFFRAEAGFTLLAPPRLPPGWKATSVRFERTRPQSWHLGVLTDRGDYLGLEQARETEATMVDTHVAEDAEEGEPVVVGGSRWTSYTDAGGDYALVRRERGVTTLVVGSAPPDQVVDYVESLRAG